MGSEITKSDGNKIIKSDDSLPTEEVSRRSSQDEVRSEDLPNVCRQASQRTCEKFNHEMKAAGMGHENSASDLARRVSMTDALIAELENGGPAGLVHLAAVSCALKAPIRVWNPEGELEKIIGQNRRGTPVDVEYHQPRLGETTGHWSLKGNVDPSETFLTEPNGCLFAVLAAQTGCSPSQLRAKAIQTLKKNVEKVADNIDELVWLRNNYNVALMLGGARYVGKSEDDAALVLDNSQNARCHGCGPTGHPRGHASHPSATGPQDSVENYSYSGNKSGFLSRQDQDFVGHLALSHQAAKQEMVRLNKGAQSTKVEIRASQLVTDPDDADLPQARWWSQGQPTTPPRDFRSVVLILRHHEGEQNNPDADVFVHTFYPTV